MSPRTEISSDIQPLDPRAVSYIADAYVGRQRRFDLRPVTSGLPRRTDILRVRRHVSKVPNSEVAGFGVATLVHDVASPQSHIGKPE